MKKINFKFNKINFKIILQSLKNKNLYDINLVSTYEKRKGMVSEKEKIQIKKKVKIEEQMQNYIQYIKVSHGIYYVIIL